MHLMGLVPQGTADFTVRQLTPEPERELPQDPVAWVRDELREHLWSMQRKVMRSVVEHRRTAVPSCHGPGKSFIAARTVAWWIAAHEYGEAFAITTAPSGSQVKAILWRELARAHRLAGLAGTITGLSGSSLPEWHIGPKGETELVAIGRKPKDYTDPNEAMTQMQGLHAPYILIVADEATGIPPWLWNALDTLATNESARFLAIGNPDDIATPFGEACKPGSGWNVIHISAFDTPAFTGEHVPEYVLRNLTSRTYVEEMGRKWGEDSPTYRSKVLGLFSEHTEDRVVSASLIRKATETELDGMDDGAYGLDVGRFGSSESVVYRSRGGVVRFEQAWKKAPTTETEGKARRILDRHGSTEDPAVPMNVDTDGIGGGVYDHLHEDGYDVRAYHAGVEAIQSAPSASGESFVNRRSESWWNFRTDIEAGYIDLDPDDEELANQLQQPKWKHDSKGRIRVETKDELKKRGVASPDRADAAIMARDLDRSGIGLRDRYGSAEQRKARGRKTITGDLIDKAM